MRGTLAIGKQRGFTLLELLVVMAILALLASAFPFALDRALPARRVAATAQALVVALNDARAESLMCSCPVTLELHDRELVSVAPDRAGRQLRPVSIASSTQVRLTDAGQRVIHSFDIFPDGSSGAARFEITDGRRHSIVSISQLTGRIALARVR